MTEYKQEHQGVNNIFNSFLCMSMSLHARFYIQSFQMTEYFSPERALSVRLCVCVYVCLSQPFI